MPGWTDSGDGCCAAAAVTSGMTVIALSADVIDEAHAGGRWRPRGQFLSKPVQKRKLHAGTAALNQRRHRATTAAGSVGPAQTGSGDRGCRAGDTTISRLPPARCSSVRHSTPAPVCTAHAVGIGAAHAAGEQFGTGGLVALGHGGPDLERLAQPTGDRARKGLKARGAGVTGVDDQSIPAPRPSRSCARS